MVQSDLGLPATSKTGCGKSSETRAVADVTADYGKGN